MSEDLNKQDGDAVPPQASTGGSNGGMTVEEQLHAIQAFADSRGYEVVYRFADNVSSSL